MKPDFITTRKLSQTLALLQQLPGNSSRIPLVLGPEGIGKTRLLEQLCLTPPEHWLLARVQGGPLVDRDVLIRHLAKTWLPNMIGIDEKALVFNLEGMSSVGQIPVIVVDDADRLPIESLRLLLQAGRRPGEAIFYTILFADTAIDPILNRLLDSNGRAELIHSLLLSPWNREEVIAYYKLAHGTPPSNSQLENIMRKSDGIPGKITPSMEPPLPKNTSPAIPLAPLITAAILILAIATTYLFQPSLETREEPAVPTSKVQTAPSRVVALPIPRNASLPHAEPRQPEQSPVSGISLHGAEWLRKQPPKHFTLQLISLRRIDDLKRFAKKHKLNQDKLAHFAIRKEGGLWYSLVYGSYPDKRSALRARLMLPDTIDPESVWPRSFLSIDKAADKN